MRGNASKAPRCRRFRPEREYSHVQELIDNLPYIAMALLGASIFLLGLQWSVWAFSASVLYLLYSVLGAFWIMFFICPYCGFHGTRACPCGYGQIAALFRPKEREDLFMGKFKRHIPVIVPLWVLPMAGGAVFLISDFSVVILALMVLFALDSFVVLPLVSRRYGCAHCPQKETCPWMGTKRRGGKRQVRSRI